METWEGGGAPVYVTLDLETTGLDPDRDAIIEIGAVKFQGHRVLENFQTLVNPYREIPQAIVRLTGIAQRSVDRAPPFAAVAGELSEFLGALPVVGHHVSFDLGFLAKHGLRLENEVYDTWDLAAVVLPSSSSYSLSELASGFKVEHRQPHRALSDAQATHGVFVGLLERAGALDPATLAYIQHMGARSRWSTGRLFGALRSLDAEVRDSRLGMTGLDTPSLSKRLGRTDRSLRPVKEQQSLDEGELAAYMAPGGLFSRAFPGFERRPQQAEMMAAVTAAFNRGGHLMVEAGTGVGKSLAYLLPALLHSVRNGARVVVSTNTINLQEQLLMKDIPALARVLEEEGIVPEGQIKSVPLKGRTNYLCLRRWSHLARSDGLSGDDARVLSKALVWLQDTATGDRGEINLSGRDIPAWSRISAGDGGQCPGLRGEGPCFLRAARDRAESAHILVVNHALLLADMAIGGGLIPEYQHLIVDEAHHLEEAATHQLGFRVSQGLLDDEMDALSRLLASARALVRGTSSSSVQVKRAEEMVSELETTWGARARKDWDRLWGVVDEFMAVQPDEGADQLQLSITRSTRAQPGWSEVEMAWEKVHGSLEDGIRGLDSLDGFLQTLPAGAPLEVETVAMEISTWRERAEELRDHLETLLAAPAEDRRVDWIARVRDGRSDSSHTVLHSAPLNVGPQLEIGLFAQKSSVILTSATLSTQGSYDYIRDRLGLSEGEELTLGSPFDYRRAALLLIPDDMPMPETWGYQDALQQVLVGLGKALSGHALVLFTSHAALRNAAKAIRAPLEAEGVRVLAQGVDGSPRRIVQDFAKDPTAMILGTSSFWEGVDLSGGILKALVLARLPFHVPTEPVFAARSAQVENPFQDYALPHAVLRFRQGIGRLIRSSRDRGAIVVLDKRIVARQYGKAFLDSIPPCTMKSGPLSAIPGQAADWVGRVEVGR